MISSSVQDLLEVQKRGKEKMNAKDALKEGRILGIVYGRGIKENIPVVFSKRTFLKLLEKTGEGTLVKLKIGGEKERDVIIQEIQYHTYTGSIIHVDFMAVSLEEEVEVEVPVEIVGVSEAVKEQGGVLVQNVESVEVRCKAKDIPKAINVDVGKLVSLGDMIYLKDVSVPANVEVLDNPDLVLVMVEEPRTEKEMEELEQETAADVSQVEGVKKEEKENLAEEQERPSTEKEKEEN